MSTDRKNQFKTPVSYEESRRRREESSVSVRKGRKEEMFSKRRSVGAKVDALVSICSPTEMEASTGAPLSSSLEGLVAAILTAPDPLTALEPTVGLRRVLALEEDPPLGALVAAAGGAALGRLVGFLGCDTLPDLQREAAWCLLNVAASATEGHCAAVVGAGAVPPLVRLLASSPDGEAREQAVWCLGNIAGDANPALRVAAFRAGALLPVLGAVASAGSAESLRTAVWCLANLCRPTGPSESRRLGDLCGPAAPLLSQVLDRVGEDEDAATQALVGLTHLADPDAPGAVGCVLATGCLENVIHRCFHGTVLDMPPAPSGSGGSGAYGSSEFAGGGGGSSSGGGSGSCGGGGGGGAEDFGSWAPSPNPSPVGRAGVLLLGQVCYSHDPAHVDLVLEAGGLGSLVALLARHADPVVRRGAAACLAGGPCGGTLAQRTALLEGRGPAVHALCQAVVFDRAGVAKEAAWALSNLIVGGSHDLR